MNLTLKSAIFCLTVALISVSTPSAHAQNVSYQSYSNHSVLIPVASGNRNEQMPSLPRDTIKRRQGGRSFDEYYIKAMNKMNDPNTLGLILKYAALYKVDAVHIVAALVGEHTFNVGAGDYWQEKALEARIQAWTVKFDANQVKLSDLVVSPAMAKCQVLFGDYNRWECIRSTWDNSLRGQNYNGMIMPNSTFRATFFNPAGTGFTYGLGQLDPLKALMFSDVAHQVGGAPELNANDAAGVYRAIINPVYSLQYVALLVGKIAECYRKLANFDITQNPGITATIYNIGFETDRAQKSFMLNKKSLSSGGGLIYPEENYYGWAMNTRVEDFRLLIAGKWRGVTTSAINLDQMADAAIARQNGVGTAVDASSTDLFKFLNLR